MPQAKEAFAGIGLGVVVGLLLGLSATSVVGIVVTALTAGLASFLGLVRIQGPDRTVRIGCFGLACAIAALGGVMLRSGNWLAPDLRADVARWTAAGFPPEEARSLVAFERVGVRPAGREVGAPPVSTSALFSSHAGLCSRLDRLPDAAALDVLRSEEDRLAQALAAAVEQAVAPERAAILQTALKTLCG